MASHRLFVLIALMFMSTGSWAAVELSNNSIECCDPWRSTVKVTKTTGEPFPNCKVYATVMETRGAIETTVSRYSYFTDSNGRAILSYIPKRPGEKLKISVSCGENKFETIITVTGETSGPDMPSLNIALPDIETGQLAAVAFVLFAFVFIIRGRMLMETLRKIFSRKKKKKKDVDIVELEMNTRKPILKHDRKIAAKLAKKHKRKEIRLGNEFVRRVD